MSCWKNLQQGLSEQAFYALEQLTGFQPVGARKRSPHTNNLGVQVLCKKAVSAKLAATDKYWQHGQHEHCTSYM